MAMLGQLNLTRILWYKTFRFIHKPHILTPMHWLVFLLLQGLSWLCRVQGFGNLGQFQLPWNTDFAYIFRLYWLSCDFTVFLTEDRFKNVFNSVICIIIFAINMQLLNCCSFFRILHQ